EMPVIMISTYENAPYVKRALADGAAGYLLKDATPEDLSQAINVAMSGSGNVLSPRVIQNLFEDQEASIGSNGHSRRNEYRLTQRPRQSSKSRKKRLAVGPRWPWYLLPALPYGVSAGDVSLKNEICPIFMPGYSVIGRFATLDSSRVRYPSHPGST